MILCLSAITIFPTTASTQTNSQLKVANNPADDLALLPPASTPHISSMNIQQTVEITDSLIAGADYIKHTQSDITEDNAGNGNPDIDPEDGGWDWVLTAPIFNHSASASPKNIYGVTALSLYYAYLKVNDPSYKIAMDDAAGIIITDADIRASPDLVFLMFYDDLPEVTGTSYQFSAKTKYDARITQYGSAQAFAEYIRDVRASQGYENGIIAWDISGWARVAAMLDDRYPAQGYDADADAIAEVLWQDSFNDNPGYFDIIEDQGWDPTYTNKNFWWYSLGITGLINAFLFSDTHTTLIPSLVTILLDCQYDEGGFSSSYGAHPDDEDWQATAYSVISLGLYDQVTYQPRINNACEWLVETQDSDSGGWVYSDGDHYPEVGAECTTALYFAQVLTQAFIFGRFTELNQESGFITIRSTNLRIILFSPFQFYHYVNGEKIRFASNYLGFITSSFIIGIFEVEI